MNFSPRVFEINGENQPRVGLWVEIFGYCDWRMRVEQSGVGDIGKNYSTMDDYQGS